MDPLHELDAIVRAVMLRRRFHAVIGAEEYDELDLILFNIAWSMVGVSA